MRKDKKITVDNCEQVMDHFGFTKTDHDGYFGNYTHLSFEKGILAVDVTFENDEFQFISAEINDESIKLSLKELIELDKIVNK